MRPLEVEGLNYFIFLLKSFQTVQTLLEPHEKKNVYGSAFVGLSIKFVCFEYHLIMGQGLLIQTVEK
jgi:hypothetical protein